MPLNETSATPARRRRGAELEAALLDAALAELLASGYDDLTYEAVAERAQTSRAVLYRRWPSKRELALAAALRLLDSHPVPTPDTGSLRGDVLELLTVANGSRARLGLQLVAQLGSTGGVSLADLRRPVARRNEERMTAILGRAEDRGEIPTADVPRRARDVALDLWRHDVLLRRSAASPQQIEQIVDDVFLPLVGYRG